MLRTYIPPREKGDRESHQAKQPKKGIKNKNNRKNKNKIICVCNDLTCILFCMFCLTTCGAPGGEKRLRMRPVSSTSLQYGLLWRK
jgi:hypothetical protein